MAGDPSPPPPEAEINKTQKNKATEYHLGQLKARLAKLRTEVGIGCGMGAARAAESLWQ